MKATRLAVPAGQCSRSTDSTTRRLKSSAASAKVKKSCEPSNSKSRNRSLPPILCTQIQSADDNSVLATANVDVPPSSSDYEQAPSFWLPDCQWSNDSVWGSATPIQRGGAASEIGAPHYSDSSSSCSLSDSESDSRWSTLTATSGTSSGNRGQEPRESPNACFAWEEFIWGDRRPRRKLVHKRSFITNLWDFKAEMKADEISDPILVSVNVLGSPGPLRLVVDRNDTVQHTVDFALRRYTAQKRQPALVGPASCFGLYLRNPDFEALDDEDKVGHRKNRQLYLYHKQQKDLHLKDIATNDASWCQSGESTGCTQVRTWIWNKFTVMRSWAGTVVGGISRAGTFWFKYWNPRSFYRFICIVPLKACAKG